MGIMEKKMEATKDYGVSDLRLNGFGRVWSKE